MLAPSSRNWLLSTNPVFTPSHSIEMDILDDVKQALDNATDAVRRAERSGLSMWDGEEREELQYAIRQAAHELLFSSNNIQERLPMSKFGKAHITVVLPEDYLDFCLRRRY